MSAIQRILCPVDFSPVSLQALAYAERLASSLQAELVLVHAFDPPPGPAYLELQAPPDHALQQQLQAVSVSLPARQVVRLMHSGPPGEVICWLAQERGCDLIVLGTHGRTGLAHLLLGSVAEYVVRHARCPVVTVRAQSPDAPPLAEPIVLPPKAPRFL
ncbi:MAG: universal stress protein [Planctomycetes bacterium]|nr:universal stress protein [Planctomycetota bacterium]